MSLASKVDPTTHRRRSWVCAAFVFFGAGLLLSACSGLPSAGPTADDVFDQASSSDFFFYDKVWHYSIVPINETVLHQLERSEPPSLHEMFGSSPVENLNILHQGDYVTIDVWDASSGAASSSTGALPNPLQGTVIPEQVVAADGTIAVPFAGRVNVAGLTAPEAEQRVKAALEGKIAAPQIILALTRNLVEQVTVSGDAIKGSLVPLNAGTSRLLDVVAAAGGIQGPATEAIVTVARGGRKAAVSFVNVLADPAENIRLHPGDVVEVSKDPGYFTALGATGKNAKIPFDSRQVTLSGALGLSGGLLDERADPAGVFVFRYETSEMASKLCGPCGYTAVNGYVPIVYRLDMSNASAFFVAQQFQMSDHDVLYVANASKVGLEKALSMMRDLTSPITSGALVARALK